MRQLNQTCDWLQKIRIREFFTSRSSLFLLVILCDLFVLTVYIWLISIGHWDQWPTRSTYYDSLATSFSHGQSFLEIKPDPALLALPNPYDPDTRTGIDYPQDVSLYKGKFYLYFGPVPALILVFVRILSSNAIGDQYLVFAFVSGIFLLLSLLIVNFQQRYFRDISAWFIALIVLMVGLMNPFVWVLGNPSIYNAAITAGQFFFLTGFYSVLSALEGDTPSKWKMALTGLFWAAAIGSRMTQILPVGFMTVLVFAGLALLRARQGGPVSQSIPTMLALGLTLGLGLAILGWYNWARFESPLETGITYQLAGPYIQKYRQELFSPAYIIQNLYVYFLNPPKLGFPFPYLSPIKGIRNSLIPFISLPKIYYTQDSIGILYSSPFILLAIVPVIVLFLKRPKVSFSGNQFFFRWLIVGLCGSFLSAFAGLVAFFWVAERYIVDFIPCLTLLSIIGFWQLNQYLARSPLGRVLYWTLGISLIVITIIASILLALSLNAAGFRSLNPLLWRQLGNIFQNLIP